MFRPGEMVYHTGSTRSGTVVECDGDTVYIMQPNGVELDFPASELTGTPPAGNGQTEPAVQAPRILTNRDITWRVPYLANSAVQSYGADERNGSKYACIAVNPQLELAGMGAILCDWGEAPLPPPDALQRCSSLRAMTSRSSGQMPRPRISPG